MSSTTLLTALLVAVVVPATALCEAADEPVSGPPLVVVELFTSQGCSSCPPADRLLSELAGDPSVVPLAFHVDYWNDLGWRDPFSSPGWSERQRRYARRFGSRRVYTPQAVVDGRLEGVGSSAARLSEMLGAARDLSRRAAIELEASVSGGRFLAVTLDARLLEPWPAERLTAYLAVFESGLVTAVERGENGGRALANDFVVRRLEPIFDLTPAGPHQAATTRMVIEPGWRPAGLGVAAFLQDPETLEIHAAARAGPE